MFLPNKDPAAAIALMREANRRHPADLWISRGLAEMLEGYASLAGPNAARWLEDAVGFRRVAVAARPDSAALRHELALSLYMAGHFDDAADLYRDLLRLNPNDSVSCLCLGRSLARKGPEGCAAALPYFTKAIKMDPTRADAWADRGRAYYTLRKFDEALKDFSQAIKLNPAESDRWWRRGLVHVATQDWEKATSDFTRATELDPADVRSWKDLGHSLEKLKRWPEAVAAYGKAVEVESKRDDGLRALIALVWLLSACPDPEIRDPRRALELANRPHEYVNFTVSQLHQRALGVAHFRAGNWKNAVEALEPLRKTNYFSGLLFLAMAHHKLGHTDEARNLYQQVAGYLEQHPEAMKNSPDSPEEIRRFLAEAEETLGLKKK
jgi:tetratricopeptide (TPR) repeat protein